jgi:ABC-type branched-subunit amino acid transport system substrate-binding protein
MSEACGFPQEILSAYFDGEATAHEAREVRAHVGGCWSCVAAIAEWSALSHALPVEAEVRAPAFTERKARARVIRRRRIVGALIAAVVFVIAASGTVVVNTASHRAGAGARRPAVPPTIAPSERRSPERPHPSPSASARPTPSAEPSRFPGIFPCADEGTPRASDTGVTENRVTLFAPTAQSGVTASRWGDIKYGMEAMRNRINRAGGVCGRYLSIQYVDDGADAQRGATFMREAAKDSFAIAVAPSAPGLQAAIESGDIDRLGLPVVGTLGQTNAEFSSPWVWPVSVATETTARIIARDAYRRGARKFSVVFDKNYRFGPEVGRAFDNEVLRLTSAHIDGYNDDGTCIRSYCPIQAGQATYGSQIQQFAKGDFIALFAEPQTALTWMSGRAPTPKDTRFGIGVSQPLFGTNFSASCGEACDGMRIWMPYELPIGSTEPDVERYRADLQQTNPSADRHNPLVEGGYIGLYLLAEALAKTGVDLTRERFRAVLDAYNFPTGLTAPISYGGPARNTHLGGNRCLRPYDILDSQGAFAGWESAGGWAC